MRLVTEANGSENAEAVSAVARDWTIAVAENPMLTAECLAWREADPTHEAAWQEANHIWTRMTDLGTLDRPDWRAEIDALTKPFWRRPTPWAIAASIALAFGATFYFHTLPDLKAETAVAETRRLALADGSQVTLSGKSGVAVRFAQGSRRVVLDHGQVFFEVAHDISRPFTVIAGDAEIRVTGTKFDVRKTGEEVRVSVLEGRVELRKQGLLPILTPGQPERVLTAGLYSELTPGTTGFTPETHTSIPAGDWRNGRLFYKEAPLSDIIADFGRYSTTRVRIADPAVGQMKLTTSFRASQAGAFLERLPATLPVRLTRETDGAVLIEAGEREP